MSFNFKNISTCKIKIHPLLLPLLFLFWQYGSLKFFLETMFFVTLHEFSHCAAALYFGGTIKELWITPVGERAIIKHFDNFSYNSRQIILIAGPACSMAIGGLCTVFNYYEPAAINFCIGLFNLIPILPLDGGKILLNVWGKKSGTLKAAAAITRFSRAIGYLLIVMGVVQMILYPFSFSLLVVGCYVVSVNKKEYLRITYSLYKQLLQKNKNTPLPVRACYIGNGTVLNDLTQIMNPDEYFLFYRCFNGIIESKTQQEVMNLLMERGTTGRVWD